MIQTQEGINNYFYDILDSVEGNVYWKDKHGVYLGCNQYTANILSLANPKDIIGKTDDDFFSHDVVNLIRQHDLEVMQQNCKITKEDKLVFPNGVNSIQLTSKRPLYNQHKEIIGIVGTSIDITELKQAINKATKEEKARAAAEYNLHKVITTYANAVVHNLRSPLAILLMRVRFYEDNVPFLLDIYEAAKMHGLAQAKLIPATTIENLTENPKALLECLAKIHSLIDNSLDNLHGAIKIHMGQANTNELVECSIRENLMSNRFNQGYSSDREKLIHVDATYDFKFMGNSISMDQVINNLIENALYQIKKNGKGEIFVKTEDGGKVNLLRIKNTAGGAAQEIVKHLFGDDATTDSIETSGGLGLCKKVMNLFNGAITVRSVEDKHTEFTLTFPKMP